MLAGFTPWEAGAEGVMNAPQFMKKPLDIALG
jgi:hypothetical protein